jgi:hypothetical protein
MWDERSPIKKNYLNENLMKRIKPMKDKKVKRVID